MSVIMEPMISPNVWKPLDVGREDISWSQWGLLVWGKDHEEGQMQGQNLDWDLCLGQGLGWEIKIRVGIKNGEDCSSRVLEHEYG